MSVFPFDSYNLVFSVVLIALLQLLFFVFAAAFRTDKLTDISYGLTFVITVLVILVLRGRTSSAHILMAALVTVWGFRLGVYLLVRILHIGRDERFDGKRENLGKFAQFWVLQIVSIWVVLLPVILYLSSSVRPGVSWALILGGILWLLGFVVEFTADQQKFVFKKKPENRKKWIESGLWKFSRHPNYFGESLCWLGIFVITIPVLEGWMWAAAASPVYITLLLLFVSGIPLLEKKADKRYGGDPAYAAYRERTSLFVPLPPRKS
jgi:steroid 5-alpha reductase family enzyme